MSTSPLPVLWFFPLQHLAECLLHSILSELKLQKVSLEHNYIHALCRVYVGLCRQLGDVERARLFCYSLLKEGTFPGPVAVLPPPTPVCISSYVIAL